VAGRAGARPGPSGPEMARGALPGAGQGFPQPPLPLALGLPSRSASGLPAGSLGFSLCRQRLGYFWGPRRRRDHVQMVMAEPRCGARR
jgi:hypothetical protein